MNPLKTVNGTLIAGFVLMLIIGASVGGFTFDWNQFVRWLHIIAGVTWIGLLYYFNFVQVSALGAAASDEGGPGGAAITKYVAPLALNWFRWAALVTWLSGAAYLGKNIVPVFMLGMADPGGDYYTILGLGAWMGTIMLFNVWVLIWPNQKKLLGMVPATDEEKAKAKSIAFMASRTNTLLSLPMLMCMTGAVHGLPF